MWVSFAVSGEDTSRAGSLDYGKNNFKVQVNFFLKELQQNRQKSLHFQIIITFNYIYIV